MSKVTYFQPPQVAAMKLIARRLKSEGVSRLARVAEIPERTAREWVEHPEKMRMQEGIALLMAAEIPEAEIARMIRGTR